MPSSTGRSSNGRREVPGMDIGSSEAEPQGARYMTLETMTPLNGTPIIMLPAVPAT